MPALRDALRNSPSAEAARRIDQVLRAAAAPTLSPGNELRAVRAVAALELAGTAGARKLLKELSGGAAGDWLTEEARAALNRR